MEEKLKRGRYLTLSTLIYSRKSLTLLDSRSKGNILDYSYIYKLNVPTFKLIEPIPLYLGNRK